jgi:predicted dithiol-disulfide oxidoreductase (DUF899 family)
MPSYDSGPVLNHSVVSHDRWLDARIALLEREKELSRQRDEVNRLRRELPWERVEKRYEFQGPNGRESLADLFEGRRQLVVYHFMFAPEATEGCKHCSFWAEGFDALAAHLPHRDTTFAVVSRAPLATLDAYKRRMGWHFKWVSSDDDDFNYDLGASFRPEERKNGTAVYNYRPGERGADREGASVFYKAEDGTIYHTYSTWARGIDLLNVTYNFLDLTPKGRDEAHLSAAQAWVRYKDRYEA